jgi:hypothetical protein
VDWIHVAHDKDPWLGLETMTTNFCVSYMTGNCLTSFKTISFSRRTLLCGVSVTVMMWGILMI